VCVVSTELVSWKAGIVLRERLEEGRGLMDGYKVGSQHLLAMERRNRTLFLFSLIALCLARLTMRYNNALYTHKENDKERDLSLLRQQRTASCG
jgi:hypothetical protein